MKMRVAVSAAAVAFLAACFLAYAPVAGASAASSTPLRLAVVGGTQTASVTYYLSSDMNPEKGEITDRQTITLDGGYDVPLLNSLDPEHRIDLKWTIANTTTCEHLGTVPCVTPGLRYPGLACVDADGHPTDVCGGPGWDTAGLTDDPRLGCPAYPSGGPAVPPGKKVTICTSSLLFPQEAGSLASYFLGYLPEGYARDRSHDSVRWQLTDPWDPRTGTPAPIRYQHRPCADEKWSGDVPPPCTATGAFRRVYSAPGYFGATTTVKLPAQPSDVPLTMPGEIPELTSQAGYAYLEAWTGTGKSRASYEFGLVYHEDTNSFSLYSRGSSEAGRYYWTHGIFVRAGDKVRLALYAYPSGHTGNTAWPVPAACVNDKLCLIGLAQDLTAHRTYVEGFKGFGWRGNGAILARMTTVAQTMKPSQAGNIFDDGAIFGPITWSNARLATISAKGIIPAAWRGNVQSWPNDRSRVIVTAPSGLAGETDTLYLHP